MTRPPGVAGDDMCRNLPRRRSPPRSPASNANGSRVVGWAAPVGRQSPNRSRHGEAQAAQVRPTTTKGYRPDVRRLLSTRSVSRLDQVTHADIEAHYQRARGEVLVPGTAPHRTAPHRLRLAPRCRALRAPGLQPDAPGAGPVRPATRSGATVGRRGTNGARRRPGLALRSTLVCGPCPWAAPGGETLGLSWNDVDLDGGRLTVRTPKSSTPRKSSSETVNHDFDRLPGPDIPRSTDPEPHPRCRWPCCRRSGTRSTLREYDRGPRAPSVDQAFVGMIAWVQSCVLQSTHSGCRPESRVSAPPDPGPIATERRAIARDR